MLQRATESRGHIQKLALLTDTPVKQQLEIEKNKAQSSKNLFEKKGKQRGESKSGPTKNNLSHHQMMKSASASSAWRHF